MQHRKWLTLKHISCDSPDPLAQTRGNEGAAAGELPGAVQALASRGVLQAAARSARTLATAACVSADYKWSLAGVEEGSEKYLAARLGCHERSAKVKRDGSKRRGKSKSCGWLRASSAVDALAAPEA